MFGELRARFNAPFAQNLLSPTGSEWQTSDAEEIRLFQDDPLCGKPFSNAMTYSVLKRFHNLWLREQESRILVDLPILISSVRKIRSAARPPRSRTSSLDI
jgi:hypothetical protein